MKMAYVLVGIPLADEATEGDAKAIAELITMHALTSCDESGEPADPMKLVGQVIEVELTESGKLGAAGARALLRRLGEGARE